MQHNLHHHELTESQFTAIGILAVCLIVSLIVIFG